jgi:hypothetical protein
LPEYELTAKGKLYLNAAIAIKFTESSIGAGRLSAKAWNVPILLALEYGIERFQEIRHALQPVTPRMLSIRLDELNHEKLVDRFLSEQPRPSFLYRLARHVKDPVHQLSVELDALVEGYHNVK